MEKELKEIFEHNLRSINNSKSKNDLIMVWFNQTVEEIKKDYGDKLTEGFTIVSISLSNEIENLKLRIKRLREGNEILRNENIRLIKTHQNINSLNK